MMQAVILAKISICGKGLWRMGIFVSKTLFVPIDNTLMNFIMR